MSTVLICRTCGTRTGSQLATNELELVNVGMLERACDKCGRDTRWGLAQDYRRVQRRATERRATLLPHAGPDRRHDNRRTGAERRT
jgi:hypothetical protein